jgi:CubicO group peptidase (beta-lactamase class C family)
MQGFPVPPDKRVTRDNFVIYPYSRWAFQNIRALQPTRGIFRGGDPVAAIAADPVDLDALTFTGANGRQVPLGTWFDESGTDSFLVLHKGRLVYERYFNGMARSSLHQMFSVTKSFVGTLALCLIDEGAIEPGKQVQEYLPELRGSAFGEATVQQVLDMTNSLEFSEDYTDPAAGIRTYSYIFGNLTAPPDYRGTTSIFEYLSTLRRAKRDHGEAFAYLTPNTDVLGWLISRVSGKSVAQQVEQRIWQRLGVERDGYMWINALGEEMAGGGLNMTAADAARFGQMILQNGRFNGQRGAEDTAPGRSGTLQPGLPGSLVRAHRPRLPRPVVDVRHRAQARQRHGRLRPAYLHRCGGRSRHRQAVIASAGGERRERGGRPADMARDCRAPDAAALSFAAMARSRATSNSSH